MHRPLFGIESVTITGWKLVGYVGTILFAGRWLVQLWASKRSKQVTMPRMFWYMSIVGSLMALSYFIFGKNDSVGILQNSFPFTVACYNLYLDISHKRRSMDEDA
ncbi:lipid-A-disaccharide synthase N-terminal domain-containing protein [Sulfuriroseicoccus oceanibius]